MIPAYERSRTAAWLRARPDAGGVTLYWSGRGRRGQHSWARILGYHARIGGFVKHAPIRDVFGISRHGLDEIKNRTLKFWDAYKASIEAGGPAVVGTPRGQKAGRLPGQPQRVPITPLPTGVNINVNLDYATFSGGSKNELLGADWVGGFKRFGRAEGPLPGMPGWKPPRIAPAKPMVMLMPTPIPRSEPTPRLRPEAPQKPSAPPASPPTAKPQESPRKPSEEVLAKLPEVVSTSEKGDALLDLYAKIYESAGVKASVRGRGYMEQVLDDVQTVRGMYSPRKREIFLNERDLFWSDPDSAVKEGPPPLGDGFKSSPHRDRTFWHELGHYLHDLDGRLKRAHLSAADKRTAEKVSRYATTNSNEFVAEVFTGLRTGMSYTKDVMALYRKLGGP